MSYAMEIDRQWSGYVTTAPEFTTSLFLQHDLPLLHSKVIVYLLKSYNNHEVMSKSLIMITALHQSLVKSPKFVQKIVL